MEEERRMILKMIEDGKITADEGLKLLNALQEKDNPKTEKEPSYLSDQVDWGKGKHYRRKYKQPSSTHKFTDFIESAIQKIKEFDLDFNFGPVIEINHIFQHRDPSFFEIDVALENGSVTLIPWDEPDVRVECKVKVYKVKDSEAARQTFLKETSFEVDEKLSFYVNVKSIKVNATIYIPRKQYDHIKLYTFNGHLKGDDIAARELNAKTVNGSITFENSQHSRAHLETVNGAITLSNTTTGKCEAKTMNGPITLKGDMAFVDVETVNGTILYRLQSAKESEAYLKTGTGSVDILIPVNLKTEGQFKTNVGGFSCDLPEFDVLKEKKEIAAKSLTFISNKEIQPTFVVEAESKTGSISIQNKNS
ncbi:DUF4097 family beta strand repeat-containing protein [Anaerobacillus sp. MEB173]|uniref:DUF4097 family beta strand repeat-containing protein n=1 Tax=Anaerobacillus sp. MEB173 TaxID=3383345 RepID=UPI003F8F9384